MNEVISEPETETVPETVPKTVPKTIVWYVADPMCSWCWGFSSVVERLKRDYQDTLPFALLLGGLRPFTREPISDPMREEILHHWRQVHDMTGQEFSFAGAMPEGFIYDTEPPCRAVVAVGKLYPSLTFDYFKAVQRAFYLEQKNVTRESVLAELLETIGVDGSAPQTLSRKAPFLQEFRSEACQKMTQAHFHKSREFGVRGFPSMILQHQKKYFLLTSGYRSYDELRSEIEACLREAP
ncbi:MAG: DsbA family protein [Gammaproteobacteria bacterium]|nr:DsbA family protein [Gammaproteobacteria bacterium]